MELKLDEGCYSEGEIMQTVERLKDAGLLNDEKYAADFIESRLNTKPVSKFRLHEQLRAHLVPEEIIEEALSNVSDGAEYENAVELVKKYSRQFSAQCSGDELKKRVYTRLSSRGFSRETILRAMGETDE